MIKFYKILFLNTMIMGTLIAISSYSWMGMWMGLEINLLSMIPLFNSTKNMYSSESSLKYFLSQTMASLILMFSIILMLINTEFIAPNMNSMFLLMLNSALLTKLGAAPFHFWFPEVMEGLNWINCLLLLTWQKISPMILIMNNNLNFNFLTIIIIISLMIGGIMSFNQTSLRKILTFSSINHIAWMLASMLSSYSIWLIYFMIYCLITFNIIILFKLTNSFYLKQIFNSFNMNKMLKFTFMMNFLSLGGLPPFIGFMPKWMTINYLINENFYFLSLTLIIFTLITLFVYLRMIFSSLMMSFNETKNSNFNIKNFILIFFNVTSLLMLIICTMMFNMM